ncbi:MAG: hypothetical protein ABIH23_13010, partial [bacterium]
MAGFHSRTHDSHERARAAEHERQQEEFIAGKSYELYQEHSKKAERETRELLSPIPSFRSGKLEDPDDIDRLNEALSKASSRLRTHERVKQIIEEGVSAEALRNTPTMLVEFNSMIEGYRARLDEFRNKIPQLTQSLQQERDRKDISGITLLRINSKIQELGNVVPDLEQKLA